MLSRTANAARTRKSNRDQKDEPPHLVLAVVQQLESRVMRAPLLPVGIYSGGGPFYSPWDQFDEPFASNCPNGYGSTGGSWILPAGYTGPAGSASGIGNISDYHLDMSGHATGPFTVNVATGGDYGGYSLGYVEPTSDSSTADGTFSGVVDFPVGGSGNVTGSANASASGGAGSTWSFERRDFDEANPDLPWINLDASAHGEDSNLWSGYSDLSGDAACNGPFAASANGSGSGEGNYGATGAVSVRDGSPLDDVPDAAASAVGGADHDAGVAPSIASSALANGGKVNSTHAEVSHSGYYMGSNPGAPVGARGSGIAGNTLTGGNATFAQTNFSTAYVRPDMNLASGGATADNNSALDSAAISLSTSENNIDLNKAVAVADNGAYPSTWSSSVRPAMVSGSIESGISDSDPALDIYAPGADAGIHANSGGPAASKTIEWDGWFEMGRGGHAYISGEGKTEHSGAIGFSPATVSGSAFGETREGPSTDSQGDLVMRYNVPGSLQLISDTAVSTGGIAIDDLERAGSTANGSLHDSSATNPETTGSISTDLSNSAGSIGGADGSAYLNISNTYGTVVANCAANGDDGASADSNSLGADGITGSVSCAAAGSCPVTSGPSGSSFNTASSSGRIDDVGHTGFLQIHANAGTLVGSGNAVANSSGTIQFIASDTTAANLTISLSGFNPDASQLCSVGLNVYFDTDHDGSADGHVFAGSAELTNSGAGIGFGTGFDWQPSDWSFSGTSATLVNHNLAIENPIPSGANIIIKVDLQAQISAPGGNIGADAQYG